MKKSTLLLLTALSFIAVKGFAQVRPDIYIFTSTQRTILVNAFLTEYIT